MCGIIGQVERTATLDKNLFDRMRDTLAHRGPDGAGTWISPDGKIGMGHRRLSFLDLSDKGSQPMADTTGLFLVTLNGEIYNYIELRAELRALGHVFCTSTDTEVLLHGYVQWGMEGLLKRISGMFAFAILDRKLDKLFLVRDRFGIKPIYYHLSQDRLIFASELKGIMASELVPKRLNMSAFTDYFVYRYVPSPGTIWEGVSKLPPATVLSLDVENLEYTLQTYWTLHAANGKCRSEELVDEVGKMLSKSIDLHSRSDVEIGSFLSGGYDSSAIALYLSKVNSGLRTFSIGFDSWSSSEHFAAEKVSKHLSIRNSALIADASSLDLLGRMADVYDEPIADISIIPTYMVSRLASQHVKAVMSGEGADEVFGGYQWQKDYFAQWHKQGLLKKLKVKMTDRSGTAIPYYANAMAMGAFGRNMLLRMLQPEHHRHLRDDIEWFYRQHYRKELSPLKSIQNMDIKCFMGELVLTKVDRASMANSLEVRVPFLDYRIFERVFACDERIWFRPSTTKFLLHEQLKGKLPETILNRPKQGFVGPDNYYMNIQWYAKLLQDSRLVQDGIVNETFISELLAQKDHWRLWKVSVMENWYRRWM